MGVWQQRLSVLTRCVSVVRVRVRVCVRVCACVCACVRACLRVCCVRASMCEGLHGTAVWFVSTVKCYIVRCNELT